MPDVQPRFTHRQGDLGQGGLVAGLATGGLEKYGGRHLLMEPGAAHALHGLRIQPHRVGLLPGDVREDGRLQPVFPQLLEDSGPEVPVRKRRRAQGDQGLPPPFPEGLLVDPGDPQGQKPQDAPRPLEPGKGLPFALEDREHGGVEGVGGLKERLRLVRREPLGDLLAVRPQPLGVSPGGAADLLGVPYVLKKPSAHDLGDLRPLRKQGGPGQAVQGLVQALEVGLILGGHLVFGHGEGDHQHGIGDSRRFTTQHFKEAIHLRAQPGVIPARVPGAADEVEHLVHQDEDRLLTQPLLDHLAAGDDPLLVVLGYGGVERRAAQLPGDIPPGGPTPGLPFRPDAHEEVEPVADEDRHPGLWDAVLARLLQELGHPRPALRPVPRPEQVIQQGEEVGLAAAELGDEVDARRGAHRLPGQAPEHPHRQFPIRLREVSAGEEAHWVSVILGRPAVHHLIQVDGELRRVQRDALAQVLPGDGHLMPRFQVRHVFPPPFTTKDETASVAHPNGRA
ncbi:hypothetical protein HRbin08_01521 [bacterium HR08]|nr:hypothetical protein HRbin08_01521 [bacterium HR08]